MLFGHAYIERPFGYLPHHDAHAAAGGHRGCDGHYLSVGPGQLQKGLSEDILVSGGSAGRRDVALAGHGVKCARSVPYGLVLFRRPVSFALLGDDVQALGTLDVAQGGEGSGQLADVVAVNGSEVSESEGLEQGTVLEDGHLGAEHEFLDSPAQPGGADQVPYAVLYTVVCLGCGYFQQVAVQASHALVYGDVVVVEDDQDVGRHSSGVVEAREGHAAGHGAVTDDGHYRFIAAGELCRYGHAQGGRDGSG